MNNTSNNNYLTFLNDNYFYEIGYERKESKLKDIKMKKRQYRSNQGRSPEKVNEIFKLFAFIGKILILPYLIYKIIKND
ncbi:MAG: hypothetical protein Tp139SUR460282_14 [Prokaryotic dsDNA virus sp.]|jgi:hypothetical protein|nr:MAG: hypothetical protein Tp139SUR460282_14 [Prokaryotic dsDNA virus sp.]|tara:strand:+ start:676 stop:912 length:237 start_codon:yes stop_codon:yes gene_type:complete